MFSFFFHVLQHHVKCEWNTLHGISDCTLFYGAWIKYYKKRREGCEETTKEEKEMGEGEENRQRRSNEMVS